MLVTVETVRTSCPNCRHVIVRGPLDFGPGVVRCKKCDQRINTGLTNWLDLSSRRKIGVVISEILGPGFLTEKSDFMGRFFGNALVCCIFSLFPLIFGIAVIRSYATRVGGISGDPGGFAEALLFPLIGLCWPAILVYRVLRLRSQSIRNRQDEQVVRW